MSTADITTDVLVIGGGLAGLRAAVAARQAGARVAVAVKGKLGRSGCSAMTTAGYAAALPQQAGDSPEQHASDTISGGAETGETELISILSREASGEIAFLEKVGGRFKYEGNGYYLAASGDHSRARILLTPNHLGVDLTVPLAAHAESLGVQKLDFIMIVELIVDDRGIAGAVGFDLKQKCFISIATRAIVLATGGAGRLFSLTSNPNDITGDGFALAAHAGARLRDMEFIQFYPWRCIDPFDRARVSIQPSTFVMGAKLYNSADERFMTAFNPGGAEVCTRDIAARGIFDQIRKGLAIAGGVRLDLSMLSPEDFQKSNPKVARYVQEMNLDHRTYRFILTPEAHYWMGGVAISANGESSLSGLYAAGEVAGGIHGANRLNSNALPDTVVFGARAGAHAAQLSSLPCGGEAAAAADGWNERVRAGSGASQDVLIADLKKLRDKMWSSLGIIRNADGLRSGLDYIHSLRDALRTRGPGDLKNFRPWLELIFLCDTAKLGLIAASARQESRGAHFREDFPHKDDVRWQGSLMLERDGSDNYSIQFSRRRVEHAA